MKTTDYIAKLLAHIASRKNTPYAWGENDCCLFAADAVLAMTGEDIAAEFRGAYSTQEGAAEILSQHGGLAGLLTEKLGHPLGPNCARRGDLVIFTAPNGQECVGVCTGPTLVCPGDKRLNTFSMALAKQSWRVD